jgi:hypothetical protein
MAITGRVSHDQYSRNERKTFDATVPKQVAVKSHYPCFARTATSLLVPFIRVIQLENDWLTHLPNRSTDGVSCARWVHFPS